ncbi:hypothetical protein [Mucilaginibacter sp.]|jgi:hypothetical protein|uniref:hypothetical protein n=1 Tax=Mucilaginibacter sp. TaxID=1882438 RepID=UPI00356AFBB3
MNELTKIAYNCKKATFLIEKKQTGEINIREKLELKIHLAGCSICRTFEKQSLMINQMVKNLMGGADEKHLDEDYKKHLQEIIDKKMNEH